MCNNSSESVIIVGVGGRCYMVGGNIVGVCVHFAMSVLNRFGTVFCNGHASGKILNVLGVLQWTCKLLYALCNGRAERWENLDAFRRVAMGVQIVFVHFATGALNS